MLNISKLFLFFLASSCVQATPIHSKRTVQASNSTIDQFESICAAAGGGLECGNLAMIALRALKDSHTAARCDQLHVADRMIDLARVLKNNDPLIQFTKIFVQQPRDRLDSQSVQYCQEAPRSPELSGLFQCQFAGANPEVFEADVPIGNVTTIPLGRNSPVTPAGSCPNHPDGPIPEGQQLIDIIPIQTTN